MAGGIPARPHPRSPASNIVTGGSGILTRGWHLRPWAPFLCLLSSSSFCPSSVFRESLGHSLFPERPFCPSHPGLLRYPGILRLRAGATSRRSLFGRGMMLSIIPRRRLPSDQGKSRTATPLIRRPRRGGAAPAFVGGPNSSPSAPRAFAPGTGTPQPPILAARPPMRPVV
jgi:hypothetical protein